MKKILKYIILSLFILNLAEIGLKTLGSSIGTILSYLSFLLLCFYYFLYLRGKPNMWLLYIGLGYFIISGYQIYVGTEREFIILMIKFLIIVLFGNDFFKHVSRKEMLYFLVIGCITVILHAVVFPDNYGRYSGFYLNPNAAGFIALVAYALSYSVKNQKVKLFIQIITTIAGLVTFSRTFILIWLIINLFSLKISLKNFRVLGAGIVLIAIIFSFGEILNLGGQRYEIFKALLNSNENSTVSSGIGEDSRTETWAMFYDEIMEHPFLGDGFGKFQGGGVHKIGPHNTYLLIAGEAGLVPFALFVAFVFYLCFYGYKKFSMDPTSFFISLILLFYLSTSHTFFDSYIKLCISLFVYNRVKEIKNSTLESIDIK